MTNGRAEYYFLRKLLQMVSGDEWGYSGHINAHKCTDDDDDDDETPWRGWRAGEGGGFADRIVDVACEKRSFARDGVAALARRFAAQPRGTIAFP